MFHQPWSLVLPLCLEQTPALSHRSMCGWTVTEPAQRNTCRELGPPSSLPTCGRQWISHPIPGNKFVNSDGVAINPGHCSHLLFSIVWSLEL